MKKSVAINGIVSSILALVSFYQFIQAKVAIDLAFAFIVLLAAIIFCLFSIMSEMKETISDLRRYLDNEKKFREMDKKMRKHYLTNRSGN